jgi:hypothetical protein
MELSASVDASYGVHRDDQSHSGMTLFLSGCPIFSRSSSRRPSQLHPCMLKSLRPYVIWLRDLLSELGYAQGSPTVIKQDNKSALTIYEKGWSKSDRTHHSIKYSYITEQISDGVIKPVYVPTEEMRVDILTKSLVGSKIHAFYDGSKTALHCWREVIGNCVRAVIEDPTVLCWLFWNQTTDLVDIMDHTFLEDSSSLLL